MKDARPGPPTRRRTAPARLSPPSHAWDRSISLDARRIGNAADLGRRGRPHEGLRHVRGRPEGGGGEGGTSAFSFGPPDAAPEGMGQKAAAEKAEEKKIYGEPRDLDREYDRATLEKAYVEIDCVRLENNPAKLEAVFNKYGFNHPKLWTAAWAKASKDKEWVAKLVLAAHTACPRPKPTEGEPKAKPAEKQP